MPVFWLLVGLLLIGAGRLGTMVADPLGRYPVATMTAFALFALYAIPFVTFIVSLDHFEREPPVLLATAFAWGAVVVTATAVPGNLAADSLIAKLVSPRFAAMWGPALAGPTVEETLKLLGVVVIALLAVSQINSVVDGMVYGAMVGLGYQVMENVSYAAVAVQTAGAGDRIDPVFSTFIVRGVLAGPWSHTVFTALAGAGIGYAVVRVDRSRAARASVVALCLGGAWLCHFGWNSPLLADGFGFGTPGQIVALLVKGAPVLALALVLAHLARRREADYYATLLSALADPRIVTPAELRAISSLGGQAALRRTAYARAGAAGDRAARRLQECQARLAVELSRGIAGASGSSGSVDDDRLTPAATARVREVLSARQALAALDAAPGSRRPFAGSTVMWLIGAWVTVLGALGLGLMLRALT
jgi:RsiW-degrading membrane proteinase PrsW (M82 family)